jgi:hypothetical protein
MDPSVIHPIVHSRATDACDLLYGVDWEELSFFAAAFAKENSHEHTPNYTMDCDPLPFLAEINLLKCRESFVGKTQKE